MSRTTTWSRRTSKGTTTSKRRRISTTTRREPAGGAVPVALALGGNLGLVEETLRQALRQLGDSLGPLRVASLYRTVPLSPVPQPDFLNTAALAYTSLPPEAVLALAKALERAAGRRRGARFGPRPLDVDLLLYGSRTSSAPELTLPHPRLAERRFVLAPLAEIAPELAVPPDGTTVAELLARLPGQDGVERIGWTSPLSL
ncbi:MAG TPA: 2-amino-4-hydroxy-6-hydroxymethyldihydropteridine diphosphokinase [Thermoanaerobaculia bacterium]|nr:2-amino-4-hydroxy-6-hydroxymethyldihydropteridine diphosphokinase [Thermoanaerobaculia bacterium]